MYAHQKALYSIDIATMALSFIRNREAQERDEIGEEYPRNSTVVPKKT